MSSFLQDIVFLVDEVAASGTNTPAVPASPPPTAAPKANTSVSNAASSINRKSTTAYLLSTSFVLTVSRCLLWWDLESGGGGDQGEGEESRSEAWEILLHAWGHGYCRVQLCVLVVVFLLSQCAAGISSISCTLISSACALATHPRFWLVPFWILKG